MAEDRDERDLQEHIIRTEGQSDEQDRFGELRAIAGQRELSASEHTEYVTLYDDLVRSTAQHFTPEQQAADLERRSNETYARDPDLQALRIETLVERFSLHEERWQALAQTLETLDKRLVEYEKRLERYEERERDREREQGWERSR